MRGIKSKKRNQLKFSCGNSSNIMRTTAAWMKW